MTFAPDGFSRRDHGKTDMLSYNGCASGNLWLREGRDAVGGCKTGNGTAPAVYETGVLRLLLRGNSMLYVALLRSTFGPLTGELHARSSRNGSPAV